MENLDIISTPTHVDNGEDDELSWFNAGVRVGIGIGLGMCVGIGIGVGFLMSTYQATTRSFRRTFLWTLTSPYFKFALVSFSQKCLEI